MLYKKAKVINGYLIKRITIKYEKKYYYYYNTFFHRNFINKVWKEG